MSAYTVSCRGTCRFEGGKVSVSVSVSFLYIPCYENFVTKCDAYVSLCYDLSVLAFLLPVDLSIYIHPEDAFRDERLKVSEQDD
jgi:hypothetical protein